MNNEIVVSKDYVSEFGEALKATVLNWRRAGEVYVQAIDADPANKTIFFEKFPEIPPGVWTRIESVGRGTVLPELITSAIGCYKQVARLPISEQKMVSCHPIELLLANGDILKVKINDLQKDQIKQVFAIDHVRSIQEQKAYLEQSKSKYSKVEKAVTKSYSIVGKGKVEINGFVFTVRELSRIISEAA